MTSAPSAPLQQALSERAPRLRRDFDRAFALPRPGPPAAGIDLLSIQLDGQPCALRLAEVASLHADRALTPLPQAPDAVLGLAGIGGRLVAVYDLRRLLGAGSTTAPRWLVMAAARPVAMAFDGFAGQRSLAADAFAASAPEPGAAQRPYVRTLANLAADGAAWVPVIELASVLASLGGTATDVNDKWMGST